jgi:hypothetical protein
MTSKDFKIYSDAVDNVCSYCPETEENNDGDDPCIGCPVYNAFQTYQEKQEVTSWLENRIGMKIVSIVFPNDINRNKVTVNMEGHDGRKEIWNFSEEELKLAMNKIKIEIKK